MQTINGKKITIFFKMASFSICRKLSVIADKIESTEMVVSTSGKFDSKLDSPGSHYPACAQQYSQETSNFEWKNSPVRM